MNKYGKPTIDEILALEKKLTDYYNPLKALFERDEKFYELAFGSELDMPDEFVGMGIVLPTARDFVDTFVDHIDVANARVFANKKGVFKKSDEEAEMFRKFGLGVLHMTNLSTDISQWRVAAKHFAMHGLGVLKTLWDADMWPDKPEQKDGESEEHYAERIDEWRIETHNSLPIVIQAVHPYDLIPIPSFPGVIEVSKMIRMDAERLYPWWDNPENKTSTEEVKKITYWDKDYHCELIDGEPILKVRGGIDKHPYGFFPYVLIESGLGNVSIRKLPEMRYVGILRYIFDMLKSESRDYSISDVVLSKTAWGGGFLENKGNSEATVKTIEQGNFGTWQQLPPGITPVTVTPQVPPQALNDHLARTSYYLQAHAAPASLRGMGEDNVRSGADRRLVISEAMSRFNYASEAFQAGAARVLINCAKIFKNVIPGDVRVWARTPTDEFDEIIEKAKLKEPFTCYVEFSPVSDEDEYRRHTDLEQLVSAGIVTPKWARQQMANVDPKAMELDVEKQKLLSDPGLNQMLSSYAQAQLAKAIQARVSAEQLTETPPTPPMPQPGNALPMNMPISATGNAPVNQLQPPTTAPMPLGGGRLVPPIPNRAPLGSGQAINNQMANVAVPRPKMNQQGVGGGGNR